MKADEIYNQILALNDKLEKKEISIEEAYSSLCILSGIAVERMKNLEQQASYNVPPPAKPEMQ